jgi:dienelactone hydrolase
MKTCVLAVVASLTLAASGARAGASEPGFTAWEQTFVDTSRTTRHPSGVTEPQRTLVTAIYRPSRKGRFPLIVFSHGFAGHPDKFTELFAAWAAAGYVVAAPAFPLTNDHAVMDVNDLAQQPGDVSFVLGEVLALAKDRGSPLFRAIKRRRIGTAGLSLGGITTYNVVYRDCCRDERITAAIVMNGVRPGVVVDGHVPFLIAHSDTDPLLPYASARQAFDEAEPPVWLHTFYGASHASQWEDDVTPYDDLAEQVTLDFWDATLKKKRRAFARLERDATVPDLSSIEAKR